MRNLRYLLIAVTAWGFWAFLPKIATRYISPPSAMVYEVVAGVILGVWVLYRLKPDLAIRKKGSLYAFLNGIFCYGGVLCYLHAISEQNAIIVAPLSATYPIVTLMLGAVFFRERFRRLNYLGIALALFAIFLLLT
jgi:transporter family protein